MGRYARNLIGVAAAGLAVAAFLSMFARLSGVVTGGGSTPEAPPDDPKLFANRVWVDARADERALAPYLVPIEVGSKRVGSLGRASKFAFAGEVFQWRRESAGAVRFELPQRQKSLVVPVRTWACPNDAPKGYDLCMELGSGDDRARLYSRKGWRKPKTADADADAEATEDLPVPAAVAVDPGAIAPCDACAPTDDGAGALFPGALSPGAP